MPLIFRDTKGAPLTSAEGDANIRRLDAGKDVVDATVPTALTRTFNRLAGYLVAFVIATSGAKRWQFGGTADAEAGSNAGTDFFIDSYADNGTTIIGRALSIVRSTLAATFGGALNVVGLLSIANNLNFSTGASKILADFSNGTPASRLMFQSNVANGATLVSAVANGTGSTSAFVVYKSDYSQAAYLGYDNTGNTGVLSISNVNFIFSIAGTTRLKVDTSGNRFYGQAATSGIGISSLLVGSAASNTNGTAMAGDGSYIGIMNSSNAGNLYISKAPGYLNSQFAGFFVTGTQVGFIAYTSGATQYSTSSDYRLKENLVEMNDDWVLESIENLKLYQGNWKKYPDKKVDFLIAHELAEVIPEAVIGEKDAVEYSPILKEGADLTNVQPEDVISVEESIVAQGVDHSKTAVRNLAAVKALIHKFKQQQIQIDAFEQRILALENK